MGSVRGFLQRVFLTSSKLNDNQNKCYTVNLLPSIRNCVFFFNLNICKSK